LCFARRRLRKDGAAVSAGIQWRGKRIRGLLGDASYLRGGFVYSAAWAEEVRRYGEYLLIKRRVRGLWSLTRRSMISLRLISHVPQMISRPAAALVEEYGKKAPLLEPADGLCGDDADCGSPYSMADIRLRTRSTLRMRY
jgi:hypothetical protein